MSDELVDPPSGPIDARLRELMSLATTPLLSKVITLEAQLGTAVDGGAAVLSKSDSYLVPNDSVLLIERITCGWRSANLANEANPNAGLFTLYSFEDLVKTRLSQVVASLQLQDKKLDIFDNRALTMLALWNKPIVFPKDSPLLLPPTYTLKASFNNAINGVTTGLGVDSFFSLQLHGSALPFRV